MVRRRGEGNMREHLTLLAVLLLPDGGLSEGSPSPGPQNSLLTDRALLSPFNPLASPFGPLSPNGVRAAHAGSNLPHPFPHPHHPVQHLGHGHLVEHHTLGHGHLLEHHTLGHGHLLEHHTLGHGHHLGHDHHLGHGGHVLGHSHHIGHGGHVLEHSHHPGHGGHALGHGGHVLDHGHHGLEHLHHPLVPGHHPLITRGGLGHQVPLGACSLVCSILDLLVFNPEFSTFVSLVKAGGLVGLMSQPGPMTVFAPTNAAFDALPPPAFAALAGDKVALQALLLRHMSRGAIHYSDLPPGPTPLITGAGEKVTITAFPHEVHITSILAIAQLIDLDNEAVNGVVHVVDTVF